MESFDMRKQYHFCESKDGLLAWDVHRLICLTKGIQPCLVDLTTIRELDEPYWYSSEAPAPTCRDLIDHMRLVEAAELMYPIILSPDGRVMDGMHRVAKALLLSQSQILAIRLHTMPEPDYIGIDPDELPYDDAESGLHEQEFLKDE